MPQESRQDDFSHIPFEREPDIESHRRTRRPPPRPPRVAGRQQHGTKIDGGVRRAADSVVRARQRVGVEPSRLLVLEFSSWDAGASDIFENRFDAAVVDESVSSRQLTRIIAQSAHGGAVDVEELARKITAAGNDSRGAASSLQQLRIRRANKGDIDKAKRLGVEIPEDVASTPSALLVVEAEEWDDATERALQELGVNPLGTHEQKTEAIRVLVQFPTLDAVHAFEREAQHYVDEEDQNTKLPPGLRRRFFDALEWVDVRQPEDRMGARLRHEGLPDTPPFPLDVDLWHPGTVEGARDVLNSLRGICSRHQGRVVEDLRISNLVLARVEANQALAQALLEQDLVARVNLPPVLPAAYTSLFERVDPLPDHAVPDGTEPLVTAVDSGVLAGHALLRGWIVEERDFDTGESTSVDQHGHGTWVAGLLVYGDIARCLNDGAWIPRTLVASAKVLCRDPFDGQRPVFPEGHRPEKLVEQAIRHFHRERGCRVFNLSVGNVDDVYGGGRQFAWAEALDQLARELDVVLVVSAGNVFSPPWPNDVTTRVQFQEALRDTLLQDPACRVCSPATASLAVTVGAITRSERTDRHVFAAAPEGAPSPFSRLGPGYQPKETQRAVKPEFVAFGGNYAVQSFAGGSPEWVPDIQLGEPTTRLNTDGGRMLTAVSGTSFAAPQVSFAAAFALRAAGESLGTTAPTANCARALLGVCADIPPCGADWLLDPGHQETWDKLRRVGYGQVDVERVVRSLQHDVCLMAEDTLAEDHWHLYAIRVPPAFIEHRGERGIVVSLAYDPAVRASRRDYLSRTMWVEVLKGLSPDEIERYRSPHVGAGGAPSLPQSKLLDMRPTKSDVQWSTLQVRRRIWTRASSRSFPIADGYEEPVVHVLVGSQKRFPTGEDTDQRYALAIRLRHSNDSVELYQQLRTRVRARVVARVRVEPHR